jgi:hypothetical protein
MWRSGRGGNSVSWVLVNQGFTIKVLSNAWKDYKLKPVVFKIYLFGSALDQCFQTHSILQTGKLTFLSGSWGMEREREEQSYNHCVWRTKVLGCLSVALWLGNTVLHLRMPMVSWLYKSWSHMFRYHSHAPWAMEDSVFRSSPVLTNVSSHDLVSWLLSKCLFLVAWLVASHSF